MQLYVSLLVSTYIILESPVAGIHKFKVEIPIYVLSLIWNLYINIALFFNIHNFCIYVTCWQKYVYKIMFKKGSIDYICILRLF